MATTALVGVLEPAPVMAQAGANATRQFDIPAQSLREALLIFSQQSGLQVTAQGPLVEGRTSTSVSGDFAPTEALGHLLTGTGLTYRFEGRDAVRLEDTPQVSDGTITLGALRVEGAGGAAGAGTSGNGGDPDAPYHTAGSSSVITRETLDRHASTSVGDIFKSVPGVFNTNNRASPALDVNIRGMMGYNRVPVRIDGAMGSVDLSSYYSSRSNRNFVDPDIIGGIEISKGPQASAEGVGAIGGIVSARTIGIDDFVDADRDWGVRLKLSTGNNNVYAPPVHTASPTSSYRTRAGYVLNSNRASRSPFNGYNGSIAGGFRIGIVDLVGVFAHRETGNYFAGDQGPSSVLQYNLLGRLVPAPLSYAFPKGSEVFNTSQSSDSLLLKGVLRFSENNLLEVAYLNSKMEFGETHPNQSSYGVQFALSNNQSETWTARYRLKPTDTPWLDLRVNGWTKRIDGVRDPEAFNLTAATYPDGYRYEVDTWGTDITNTSRLLGKQEHGLSATYGASYVYEGFRNPVSGMGNVNGLPAQIKLPLSESWTVSAFGRLDFTPTNWLHIQASLRHDRFKVFGPSTQKQVRVPDATRPSGFRNVLVQTPYRANKTSPSLSVTLEPWNGIQFYAQQIRGARMLSNFELSSIVDPYKNSTDPETSRNNEIGINILHDRVLFGADKAKLKVAWFDNNVDNYFNWILADYITVAKFSGLEASVDYDARVIFFNVAATYYDRADACFKGQRSGDPVRPLPWLGIDASLCSRSVASWSAPSRFAGQFTAGARLFGERLTFGGRVVHRSRTISPENASGGAGVLYRGPATSIFDAFASFKISDTARIDVNAENLTDRYYRDFGTFNNIPSPGRTVRLGATLNF